MASLEDTILKGSGGQEWDSIKIQGLDQHHNRCLKSFHWEIVGCLMGNTGNEFPRDLSGYNFFSIGIDSQMIQNYLHIGLVCTMKWRTFSVIPPKSRIITWNIQYPV